MRFHELDRVRSRARPVKLERRNHAEFVEARNVVGPDQLQMRNGVRQAGVSVRLPGGFDAVQRLGHRLVSDRMNMHDHPLLVRGDRNFRKLGRIEQQLAILPAGPIRLGEDRRL